MRVFVISLLVVLWCEFLQASSPDFASIPLADNMLMQVVAADAIHDGVMLSMATIESVSPLEESINFYRNQWNEPVMEGLPGYIEFELNHWLVISRFDQDVNTVVQLDSTQPNQTVGFVSQRRIAEMVEVPADKLFTDLQRLSSTQSLDGQQKSVLSVYASYASVNATVQKMGRRLFDKGWSLVAMSEQVDATAVAFTHDADRLEIVVSQSQEYPSLVVVNRVTIQ